MLKNGHDSNGKQRWRCRECGKTGRWINDVTARDLGFFLDYLLGGNLATRPSRQGSYFPPQGRETLGVMADMVPRRDSAPCREY